MSKLVRSLAIALAAAAAVAPSARAADDDRGAAFPAAANAPAAQELTAYLADKSFHAKTADGAGVRTRFQGNGALSVTVPGTGYYDSGQWRTEDGKLCGSLRHAGSFCNDARLDAGALYVRRRTGEIVRYDPD